MMTRDGGQNRDQVEFTSLDELVPEDHLVRKLENAIDWRFIYEMVEGSYCEDNGRPSLDPVILIKLPVIQYMFGIRSMRQTIQEIKVNNAYRWFLGLGIRDAVPHFSTFGKNYMRRFQETDLFERIFHQWYEKELREEIDRDREAHGKKPLKDAAEEPQNDEESKPPRGSGKGAIWAMILTAIVAVGWVAIKLATGSYPIKIGSFAITETYAAVVVAAICTIVFSLIFKPTAIESAEREQTKKALKEAMAKA